uniref:Ubiquitin-like protein ATG12 n=1 Tax=Polyandrocarpa misakiensis TaxID=7723 RepID=A0A1W7GYW8_POLMI|nr:ubiquitin-like 12 [Polyandrocarpa misakiensis]
MSAPSSASEGAKNAEVKKIAVLLRTAGDAPILKKKRWQVLPSKKVEFIGGFLRNALRCEPSESIFLYVNQAFGPAPDREIGSLYEWFGGDGKLVLDYAKNQAWG